MNYKKALLSDTTADTGSVLPFSTAWYPAASSRASRIEQRNAELAKQEQQIDRAEQQWSEVNEDWDYYYAPQNCLTAQWMPSLPRKFPPRQQIRNDQEDGLAISANPVWLLRLFGKDPDDTSLAAAREWEKDCAEMELRKAEEIQKDMNFWRKHWIPYFAYDQICAFLDYWISEYAHVQAKLQ